MVAILFAVSFFATMYSSFVGKKISKLTVNPCSHALYCLHLGIFSMVNYFILNKCSLIVNQANLLYGSIHSLLVIFSTVVTFTSYRYTTLTFHILFTGAFGLLLNQIIALVVFREPFMWADVIRCLLRILSVVIAIGPGSLKEENPTLKKGILLCSISVLIAGATTILTKMGATEPSIDKYSWFFFANFFMTVYLLIYVLWGVLSKRFDLKKDLAIFMKKGTIRVFFSTISSNASAASHVFLMALVPLSYYSPVSSALSMIATFVVSKVILREETKKRMYVAVALSLLAIIL